MTNKLCREFRGRLLEALEGAPRPTELKTLSWHEHLLGCEPCRVLLEREEALEVLLATLPHPKLPPDLVRRIVVKLGGHSQTDGAGEERFQLDSLLNLAGAEVPEGLAARVRSGLALDLLLDRVPEPEVPEGLALRVSRGARARFEDGLDALLDEDSEVLVPDGLAGRVLADLEHERHVPRLKIMGRMPRYAAAAALLLALLGAPWWSGQVSSEGPLTQEEMATSVLPTLPESKEVNASLLAALDVLENDSLWIETASGPEAKTEESDLHLFLDGALDTGDELLLAFLIEEGEAADNPSDG
jgi:hypothetical protein